MAAMAYLAAWGQVRKKGGTDAQAAEFVEQAVQERAGAGQGRARRHQHLPAAQHRRRAGDLRIRGGVGGQRVRRRQGGRHPPVASASWPRTRWRSSSAPRPRRARRPNSPRPTWTTCIRRGPGDRREARDPPSLATNRAQEVRQPPSSRCSCSASRSISVPGRSPEGALQRRRTVRQAVHVNK